MNENQQKTILITGASSGIGMACAKLFAATGAKVILCARREDKLKHLATKLKTEHPECNTFSLPLDISNAEAVNSSISSLSPDWRQIDILINNAGLALDLCPIHEAKTEDINAMIDTNIKGLIYVSQAVIKIMLQRQSGHIINIGSISGRQVYPGGTTYCATKFAARALSEGMKMDLHHTPIRVSLINPGMVNTEFSSVRYSGDQKRADSTYRGFTPLNAEDIAETVFFVAQAPAHINIADVQINPTAQTASHMVNRSEITGEPQ
jgi:3-hydroxy acid dehydrogenase / malonic semialdehyde reductase